MVTHRDKHILSLPAEDYPKQEDYLKVVIQAKRLLSDMDNAFLQDDLNLAQRHAGDLFQLSYDLVRISSVLLIERNNRENQYRNKYQPTQKEIIEASFQRRSAGVYEQRIRGTAKVYPGDSAGDCGSDESGG